MIFEAFKKMREERGQEPAFLVSSGDWSVPISWQKFTDDIASVSEIIRRHAVGRTIGLLGENSYEWVVVHAACLFAGATVVPLEVTLNAREIAERLEFVKAVALIHSSLHADLAADAGRFYPGLIVAGFGTTKSKRFLEGARERIAASGKTVFDGPAPDVDRIAAIVFTSGTTSKPRGAQLTIAGFEAFGQFAGRQLAMKPGERSLMVLPLHHIFGVCTTYMMLSRGVALGVCPDFRRLYDAVERFRVNYIFLVPALADILGSKIAQRGSSVEEALGYRIDWILVGGAPMAASRMKKLEALGIKMLTGYGLTETHALYSISPVDRPLPPGSAGMAVNGFGCETKVSESGELLVKGPNVMRGYYQEPERTKDAIDEDGWFHTGDIGNIDSDGWLWITGRASRTIVLSSGKKIAPEELEEKLLALACVREAIVVGEGESRDVKAMVYSTDGEQAVRDAIAALNAELPIYKRIKHIEVRTEPFPRTSSGKIRLPKAPPVAAPPPKRIKHLVAVTAAPVMLGLGIVTVWLAFAIPAVMELYKCKPSEELQWTFDFVAVFGGLLIVIGALMCMRFVWKVFKTQAKKLGLIR